LQKYNKFLRRRGACEYTTPNILNISEACFSGVNVEKNVKIKVPVFYLAA